MTENNPKSRREVVNQYADIILKMSALFGVSTIIATAGLEYASFWREDWRVLAAIPVFALAMVIFKVSVMLLETAIDDLPAGDAPAIPPWKLKSLELIGLAIAVVVQLSLIVVAVHAITIDREPLSCETAQQEEFR